MRIVSDVCTLAILSFLVGILFTTSMPTTTKGQELETLGFEPTTIPPSMILLAGGARWAAQTSNSTLFVDWLDNYDAHGQTDGTNWGPWPTEKDMKNWTVSIAYMLNTTGLNVEFAGDMPESLAGYDLLVIHAYWAVEPRHVAMVRDFVANGGGLVILSGVPEFFRCYCKDWWTYRCPTDNASVDMKEYFGCDGNYVNTGGYANVTVDNPFNSSLVAGDTLIEGAGSSNAAIYEPHEGSQVLATWEKGCAFAYTYEYGLGRVYYQAAFEALDPPAILGDVNLDGAVNILDAITLSNSFLATPVSSNWNPNADINGDNVVNILDAIILSNNFLQHYP